MLVTRHVAAIVLASLIDAVCASAETVNCTPITSVPYTIAGSGIYCLTGDLSTAMPIGSAITVAANNVVIDLNGHKLGGLSAGPGTLVRGISAYERQNITIKNGTIRGFFNGIELRGEAPFTNSQGHVIEDVRVDQNTHTGIEVFGRANTIRRCQVVATGGTTYYGPDASAFGIVVVGPGDRVLDSDVVTVSKQGVGSAVGIYMYPVTDGLVIGNRLADMEIGVFYGGGGPGKYRDNLASSVAIPYFGGTDIGNNH